MGSSICYMCGHDVIWQPGDNTARCRLCGTYITLVESVPPEAETQIRMAKALLKGGLFGEAAASASAALEMYRDYRDAYLMRLCANMHVKTPEELAHAPARLEMNPDWQRLCVLSDAGQAEECRQWANEANECVQSLIRRYIRDCAMEMAADPLADIDALRQEADAFVLRAGGINGELLDDARRPNAEENEKAFDRAFESLMPEKMTEAGLEAAEQLLLRTEMTADAEKCGTLKKRLQEIARLNAGDTPFTKAGNTVTFGHYRISDGTEPVSWIVLRYDSGTGQALLLASRALDSRPYHRIKRDVTWEKSDIRAWLNGEFLNTAFSGEEAACLCGTADKVFLLSTEEAERYFDSPNAARCVPTPYAVSRGVYQSSSFRVNGEKTCWWWLRSSGIFELKAAYVADAGNIKPGGDGVDAAFYGVRPAIRVDLTNPYFTRKG